MNRAPAKNRKTSGLYVHVNNTWYLNHLQLCLNKQISYQPFSYWREELFAWRRSFACSITKIVSKSEHNHSGARYPRNKLPPQSPCWAYGNANIFVDRGAFCLTFADPARSHTLATRCNKRLCRLSLVSETCHNSSKFCSIGWSH